MKLPLFIQFPLPIKNDDNSSNTQNAKFFKSYLVYRNLFTFDIFYFYSLSSIYTFEHSTETDLWSIRFSTIAKKDSLKGLTCQINTDIVNESQGLLVYLSQNNFAKLIAIIELDSNSESNCSRYNIQNFTAMSFKLKKKSCDLTSCSSTESDSSQERDQDLNCIKTNPLKHKTELCKNFSEFGRCPYGKKCRFAHGAHELIRAPVKKSFRKKKCNGFWNNGLCSYGVRCQFSHEQIEWQTQAALVGLNSVYSEVNSTVGSKLLSLLDN